VTPTIPQAAPENPYKLIRRAEKVRKLVAALHNAGATGKQLRTFDDAKWREIAGIVGVNYPSWQSQAEVIRDLESLEK
jgi:anaerobic glycerol-3-phosphate dehydrogenase